MLADTAQRLNITRMLALPVNDSVAETTPWLNAQNGLQP